MPIGADARFLLNTDLIAHEILRLTEPFDYGGGKIEITLPDITLHMRLPEFSARFLQPIASKLSGRPLLPDEVLALPRSERMDASVVRESYREDARDLERIAIVVLRPGKTAGTARLELSVSHW